MSLERCFLLPKIGTVIVLPAMLLSPCMALNQETCSHTLYASSQLREFNLCFNYVIMLYIGNRVVWCASYFMSSCSQTEANGAAQIGIASEYS